MELVENIITKLRALVVVTLVVTVCCLLSVFVTTLQSTGQSGSTDDPRREKVVMSDSPNAVAGGLTLMMAELEIMTADVQRVATATGRTAASTLGSTVQAVGSAAYFGIRLIGTATHFAVRYHVGNATTSMTFLARGVGTGLAFMFFTGSNLLGLMSNAPVVGTIMTPASASQTPVIIPYTATTLSPVATIPAVQAASPAPQVSGGGTIWPMPGEITTFFGVPHWPFQPTHSGLDISSGRPSGVTPIKPFRAGRVIDIVYSRYSLGNNVVIDHGNGMTSVYAHMSTISVSLGQQVDTNTVLGTEGSTGVSTGPHLHLEIRINGQPVNPQNHLPAHH